MGRSRHQYVLLRDDSPAALSRCPAHLRRRQGRAAGSRILLVCAALVYVQPQLSAGHLDGAMHPRRNLLFLELDGRWPSIAALVYVQPQLSAGQLDGAMHPRRNLLFLELDGRWPSIAALVYVQPQLSAG